MSGHSKWATIHRAKEVKDQARGKLFSKYARIITIAAKTGGGPNPDSNFKLRDAIDKARSVNMPKDNIDRAISKASEAGDLQEVVYEGFAPHGVSVIVEAATDNKNRTVAEIKHMFDKAGGSLGGPGSVAYNFDHKGLLLVQKDSDADTQMLQLIDLGAGDIVDAGGELEVYVDPMETRQMRDKLESAGIKVTSSELVMKPKTTMTLSEEESDKVIALLDQLEDHDDVQKVFANLA